MVKKEEYEKFKKDINFNLNLYTGVIIAFVLVSILLLSFVIHSYEERITEIECGIGIKGCITTPILTTASSPNPLEGWTEECYNHTNIITYNFTITYFEVNSPNMEAKKSFIVESYNEEFDFDFPVYYKDGGIIYLDSFPKAIDYDIIENKTRCSKYHLVREE